MWGVPVDVGDPIGVLDMVLDVVRDVGGVAVGGVVWCDCVVG